MGESATTCILKNVKILPNNYLQVGKRMLTLEEGTFIKSNSHIIAIKEINIGKNVTFGNSISIFDYQHIVVPNIEQDWTRAKKDAIVIGDNCWIASNALVLREQRLEIIV